MVDGLEAEYGGTIDFAIYARLDGDQQGTAFARSHGVNGVPTMMLVAPDGTELERWVGAVPGSAISSAMEEAVSAGR